MSLFFRRGDLYGRPRTGLRIVARAGEQPGMTDRRGEVYAMRGNQRTEYKKPITAQDVAVLRSIGRKSIHAFTSEDIEKAKKWAYKFYQDIGVKSPFFRAWFGDWRANQTTDFVAIAKIPKYVGTNEARKEQRGIVKNNDTTWDVRISREGETNTISHAGQKRLSEYGLAGIRSLIENAYLFDTEVHEHHSNSPKNDLIAFDHKLYSLGRDTGGNIALYKITVEKSYHDAKNTNERRFHNLRYVEKVATVGGRTAGQSLHGVSTNDDIATDFSIADLYDLVKRFDREFTAGREANPMLLNEDGTPKMFYHGAKKNGGFTEFRDWQYFTEQKQYANRYAERGNPDALYAVYLTAEKVFDTRDAKAADRGNKDIRYAVSEPQSSTEYAQMQRDSKQREALMEQSTKQTFELRRQFTEGTERAAAIADCARSESERYGLWAYSAWVVPLETAVAARDKEAALRCLEGALTAVKAPWQAGDPRIFARLTALYTDAPRDVGNQFLGPLLAELETAPAYDFLRDDPAFQSLLARHRPARTP